MRSSVYVYVDSKTRRHTTALVNEENNENFNYVQEIEELFPSIAGFRGSVNSNMLPEFYRKPRELPWQPNLGNNKPKLH